MRQHARKCPIDFQEMFDNDLNLEDEQDRPWMDYLTYEAIFNVADGYDESDLLKCIGEEDEDYNELKNYLDPEVDLNYKKKWRGLPKADETRILFYGIDAPENRRRKEGEKCAECAEVYWLIEILKRHHIQSSMSADSVIEVFAPNKDLMMTLYPCCPHCHTILPKGWFRAVDYYPISLLSPTTGGKTTLMCSWLANNFGIFNDLGRMSKNIDVFYGIDGGIDNFKIQTQIYEQADNMYRTGAYPEGTDRLHIPPMYIQIMNRDTEEIMIVGIYDCAGEILEEAGQRPKPSVTKTLKASSAFIYLVEASNMVGIHMENPDKPELKIELLSVEEQGVYQKEGENEVISAEDILNERDWNGNDPWAVYNAVMTVLKKTTKKRHMAFTIVKSDELRGRPEISAINGAEKLLRNPRSNTAMNRDYILESNLIAREMFRQLVFEGSDEDKEAQIQAKEWDFNKLPEDNNISWHCVSACEPPKPNRKYKYRAVRNAEPLIGCLLEKLDEMGWLE